MHSPLLLLAALAAVEALQPTTTLTIPCIRPNPTSTLLPPCAFGTLTLIIETPLATPTCPTTSSLPTTPSSSSTLLPIPSPTPGGPCALRPSCPPSGLTLDYLPNPFAGYSRLNSLPSSYYITQSLRPLASSLTNTTFFPQNRPPTNLPAVYPDPAFPTWPYWRGWRRNTNGGIVVDANNFTLAYHGFYRAPMSGVFSICSTADNENDVFFGHGNAFGCTDGRPDPKAKPLVVTNGGNYINDMRCADVTLVSGQYYPIRSVTGNWQGPSAFNLTIKEPGRTIDTRSNNFKGLVYPHSCGLFK